MRYLEGIINVGLKLKKCYNILIISRYTDSDFEGNKDTKRSLSRYIFIVFDDIISWKVTLQSVVALSTTKVELLPTQRQLRKACN